MLADDVYHTLPWQRRRDNYIFTSLFASVILYLYAILPV